MTETLEVAFLHDGCFYQLATLDDLLRDGHRVLPVYLPALVDGSDSLESVERLFVSDRLHPALWASAAEACVDVARRGGTVFFSGENSVDLIPGIRARATTTNFWWWAAGEDPGIVVHKTDEPLRSHLTERALRWHHHAVLDGPEHAAVLASHRDPHDPSIAGALLVVDRESTAGVIATAGLDPVYHHGSRFMPGATELLRGVMTWLSTP